MTLATPSASASTALHRTLTFWPLTLYGLGVIVGAGIYVAIGEVMSRAGPAAPLSFIVAGIGAALTGLCYAELASRFPEAAGAAAYVEIGFRSKRIGALTGMLATVVVAVSTASIARGSIVYLRELIHLPDALLVACLVGAFTAVAITGVRGAVWFAAAIGVVEIGGLVAAVGAGLMTAPDFDLMNMVPTTMGQAQGVLAGSFIAFFAFIGFENLANMAEEVEDPSRTVPRGILGAILASLVLYLAVTIAVVLSDRAGENPLLHLFSGRVAWVFALTAFFAVANGVLVQLVALARLFYGMARRRQLPTFLGHVNVTTRTPINASLAAGSIVLLAALALPFERLLVLANGLTLLVFALVDLSLWRIRGRSIERAQFTVPRWLPLSAALFSLSLLAVEMVADALSAAGFV
jgi:amino acid transporter